MTDSRNKPFNRWYVLGAVFLAPVAVCVSFAAGRLLGFEGAELVGYSMAGPITALMVVGVSQIFRGARSRSAASKIAFYTLLVFLFGTAGNLMQARAKLTAISTEIDPESLVVEEARAMELGQRIKESISKGTPDDLRELYDVDRFIKRALAGRDTTSRYLQDVARGGSDAFKQASLVQQVASMVTQGGEFSFVKFYHKEQEPILQFRLQEASGNLHYLDLYIFKPSFGNLRIDDLQYYNSGDRLSKQVIENAQNLDTKRLDDSGDLQRIQSAVDLARQGRSREAFDILESLPDDVKQTKMVLRLRLQLSNQAEPARSEELLNEFKRQFPDDSGIVFAVFTDAIARDDLDRAGQLLDDIYDAVGGDEFLLWYKANLFALQMQYQKVTALLSEMEEKYKIDVTALAGQNLSEDFLSSKDYKLWSAKRRPTQPR